MNVKPAHKHLVSQAKCVLVDLCDISVEMATVMVAEETGEDARSLPDLVSRGSRARPAPPRPARRRESITQSKAYNFMEIHFAAEHGDREEIQRQLARGVSINAREEEAEKRR